MFGTIGSLFKGYVAFVVLAYLVNACTADASTRQLVDKSTFQLVNKMTAEAGQ